MTFSDTPLNIANVVLVDEAKEMKEKTIEHHVKNHEDEEIPTKGESEGVEQLDNQSENSITKSDQPTSNVMKSDQSTIDSITKSSIEEENADNKQHIPTKSLLQKQFASQVKAHEHHHSPLHGNGKHEVKRLKPGHGTAREMLEVTYPSPMLPSTSHTHGGGKSLKIGPGKKPIGAPSLKHHKSDKMNHQENPASQQQNPFTDHQDPSTEQQNPSNKQQNPSTEHKNPFTQQQNSLLGKEAKEEAMLRVVDKLQTLSDDKLAAEMKGPILALAKQKIIEDLMSFKNSPKKKSKENKSQCKRDGHCTEDHFANVDPVKPQKTIEDTETKIMNESVNKLQQAYQGPTISPPQQIISKAKDPSEEKTLYVGPSSFNNFLEQDHSNAVTPFISKTLQQQTQQLQQHQKLQQQQQLQQQEQQRQQAIQNFLKQQPSNSQLPSAISAPFSLQKQQQPESSHQPPQQIRLSSDFNAESVLQKYPELRNSGLTIDSLARLALRVPNLEKRIEKHFANKRHMQEVAERNTEINDKNSKLYSSHDFMKQFKEYLDGPTKTETDSSSKPLQFIASSSERPVGIDSRPCRRDGSCFFPEPLYQKSPYSMSPKPDVWIKDAFLVPTGFKDDTRLTPDHLMPIGPDPRIQEYYKSYMEGHPGMIYPPPPPPPSILPPPSQAPPPTQMHMVDMQTILEHETPSIYQPQPLQQPQQPSIDMQTTVENLPPGTTIESTTTLEPPYPHGGLYQWTPFSVCSVTCGQGEKKRFRRCTNNAECPAGGVEIETFTCIEPACPGENGFS